MLSTLRCTGFLIQRVVASAHRHEASFRTRACPIHHLQSAGVRTVVAPPRKMSTVILGREAKELLLDIKRFFERRQWYADNDLAYQRVFLLHGPSRPRLALC